MRWLMMRIGAISEKQYSGRSWAVRRVNVLQRGTFSMPFRWANVSEKNHPENSLRSFKMIVEGMLMTSDLCALCETLDGLCCPQELMSLLPSTARYLLSTF